jgi:predicted nuclease with TOPRIM domain
VGESLATDAQVARPLTTIGSDAMDIEEEIARNALVQLFFERVKPRLLEITRRMAENRHRLAEFQAENRKQLTPSDRYALDCMSTLNALRRGLARIEQARALLNASPSGLKAKAARLSRDDWTQFVRRTHRSPW